ncbi:hypothetical protein ACFPRL_30525 [Pseudoclavibacter helvolus]
MADGSRRKQRRHRDRAGRRRPDGLARVAVRSFDDHGWLRAP